MKSLTLKIADFPCEIRTKDNELFSIMKNHYKNFVSKEEAEFILFLKDIWEDDKRGEIFFYNKHIKGCMNLKRKKATFFLKPNLYSLDSSLRILYSLILLKKECFLLHATGIKIKNIGFVFSGASSSGKTTIAKISKDAGLEILSDEIVAVGKENCPVVFSTPFSSEFKNTKNKKVKLSSLYFLKRGEDFTLKRLELKQSLKSILSTIVFFSQENILKKNLLFLISEILKEIPVYQLSFHPEFFNWQKVLNEIY